MAVFTYSANVDNRDGTSRVRFQRTTGEFVVFELGKALDLTSDEVARLTPKIILVSGGVDGGAGVSIQIDQMTAVRNPDGTWAPQRAIAGAGTGTGDFRVLVYSGSSYPTRPSSTDVPAGRVRYIGPVQPTDWLTNDEWVDNS